MAHSVAAVSGAQEAATRHARPSAGGENTTCGFMWPVMITDITDGLIVYWMNYMHVQM